MVQYRNPLIIKFTSKGDGKIEVMDNRSVNVDYASQWKPYKQMLSQAMNGNFDYIMVSFDDGFKDSSNEKLFKSTNIKLNGLFSDAKKQNLKVFNRFDNQLYYLNPSYKEKGTVYAPSDAYILEKYHSVADTKGEYEWQHQQAENWKKFSYMMPLGGPNDKFVEDHKSMLANPKRGLGEKDLDGFFSWQTGKPVVPGLMNDNMVGMPNMRASQYADIELFVGDRPVPTHPISIMTSGNSGFVIPMRNVNGEYAKFQVGTDITPINVRLKASAPDGVSIMKSEIFDKDNKEFYGGKYLFKFKDGRDSDLHVKTASNSKIFFEDANGEFEVKLKENIKDKLLDRGYDLPPIIDRLDVVPNGKYMWPAAGTLTGSDECRKIVSPSNPGFVKARDPKNGSDEYIVMVAEGALKGIITAKYLDTPDATGVSLADKIAGNRGLIVAQVPGVAESFLTSVSPIYTDTNLKIAGTYIAMDADGRENLSVARGIHKAVEKLQRYTPVSVLSWDPSQKGIDDALLAAAQGKITIADMKVKWGSPEKLFPLDQAEAPNPYKLDGTRANDGEYAIPQWLIEYRADLARSEQKIHEQQAISEMVQKADRKITPSEVHRMVQERGLDKVNEEPVVEPTEDDVIADSMGTTDSDFAKQFEQELAIINQTHEQQVKALAEKYSGEIDLDSYGIKL